MTQWKLKKPNINSSLVGRNAYLGFQSKIMGFLKKFGNTLASGLGMSVGQGAVNTLFGLMGQNMAVKQQKELAKYQLELQKQAPSAYMEGLKRAGISPQFAGGSVGTTAPSIPTPAQSPITPPSLAEGVSTMSNTELQNSNVLLNSVNYQIANVDLKVRGQLNDASLKLLNENLNVVRQDYKNKVQEGKNSKKQYEMLDEQLNVYKQCAEKYVQITNEELRYAQAHADKEEYDSLISSLQSFRDGLLTDKYGTILDAEIMNKLLVNKKVIVDTGLSEAKAQLVYSKQQQMLEIIKGLKFDNVSKHVQAKIGAFTYRLQMFVTQKSLSNQLKRLNGEYIPSWDENKELFELQKELKELTNAKVGSEVIKNYVGCATDIIDCFTPTPKLK